MKRLLVFVVVLLLMANMAAAEEDWLEISGDYRLRWDNLKGTVHDYQQFDPLKKSASPVSGYDVSNNSVLFNRFGLNLKATPVEDISVKARLLMYKVWGHETMSPVQGNFFGDRAFGPMDGTIGHVPEDNTVRIDYGYATWSNIGGVPFWFSAGRRPSTGGIPGNLRQNTEKIGSAGLPSNLVDFAFDGITTGFAPDIEALPGSYAKICYGKGFDSGFRTPINGLKDTDFLGFNVVPYDTSNLHVEALYMKAWHIFDKPSDGINMMGTFLPVKANLGNADWVGEVISGKVSDLNLFVSVSHSRTDPSDETNEFGGGLLWDLMHPKDKHDGYMVYVGSRYDIKSTGTKIGVEYNRGSRYWFGMVPDGDDIWTSKLGTRGNVYEAYIIQELNKKPISKRGKAFFRLGYQYSKFDYTGSNNWVGAPDKISDLSTANTSPAQFFAPIKDAKDLYLTFDVQF